MLKKEVHSPLAGWLPISGSSLVATAVGASLLSNEKQTINQTSTLLGTAKKI